MALAFGLTFSLNQKCLVSGKYVTISYSRAIVGLCDSTEYRSKHPVPNEFVRSLYIKLLGRQPETGAVQGNPIHAGRNTAEVIRDFLKSEEYAVQRSTHFYRSLLQRNSSEPSGHA
jgi:hypothetical protein